MATPPNLRNNSASLRFTTTSINSPRTDLVAKAARVIEKNANQQRVATPTQQTTDKPAVRKVLLRLSYVLPTEVEEHLNNDPVFKEPHAALLLGASQSLLKKWRQRSQGPDYYQYEGDGLILYPLSAIMEYKARHLVVTSKKGGKRK